MLLFYLSQTLKLYSEQVGSRGNREQVRQLAGMRGLMAKPQKKLTGGMGLPF